MLVSERLQLARMVTASVPLNLIQNQLGEESKPSTAISGSLRQGLRAWVTMTTKKTDHGKAKSMELKLQWVFKGMRKDALIRKRRWKGLDVKK